SKRKATDTEEEDEQSEKKYRKCEKAGCSAVYPVCFASASERCAKNGYTSRWYHLSCGEHFCNECFDHYYRSHKDGYETFASWKKDIQLTASLAATYRCGMKLGNVKRVSEVTDSWWHSMLILPPLLKESPASPFLAAYYPDCVGMSPSGSPGSVSLAELRADPCRAALCVRPDMMELDELYEFPEFSRDPTMYLALRNLILAQEEVLTAQRCAQHIVVRGLVRVRCVQELDRVLRFMTKKGLINTGVLAVERPLLSEACCAMSLPRPRFPLTFPISPSYTPPVSPSHTPPFPLHTLPVSPSHIPLFPTSFPPHTHTHTLFPPPSFSPVTSTRPVQRKAVVVVGAGASGLAAARQLHNFGFQIVNGCVNNPIALMCEQMGLKMHKLGERCDLFQEGGQVADPAIDKRMDFHFNAILDVVSEWRKDKSQSQDRPLGEKVQEVKKNFLQESGIQFSALEEKVLQFHLSNLEYACGSTLDQVSARSWDHNEFFAQFSGDHTLLTRGYSVLLNKLAEGLEIHRNCPFILIHASTALVSHQPHGE
ncbi:unnamed protein product, partial [Menidia menidia]